MIKVIIISLFLISMNVLADNSKKKDVINLFKNSSSRIKDPFKLRDPFKRRTIKLKNDKKRYGGYLQNNSYSNLPTINRSSLENIRIIGVLLGKDRRAIARTVNKAGKLSKNTYILKEGMRLGENNAEIRAIVPGGIVLVEKITNVYDQDEYIETVIPVSNISDDDKN
ncbi:MAG: pilus assembly protein PilP [Oligoflexia bacterium]|nr:pilus assembly protein PilP [Oligoflexia bacterium]